MNDEEHIKEIVKEHGLIVEKLGFGRLVGEIWTALFLNNPMTQDELKDYLGAGTSTISQAIKPLETMALIKIVGKNGRKNIYSAEGSMCAMRRKAIELKINQQIEPMIALLDEKKKLIKGKENKERIEKLEKKFTRIGKLLKTLLALPIWKKDN